jgi:nucleoside-diphosphate-sugar epimerase
MRKLFIFGFGFSSTAIAEKAGEDFDIICGTSRSQEKVDKLRAQGFEAEIFDGASTPELEAQLADTTHIVMSISPGEEDPVLQAFPNLIELAPKLEWIGYLSTVGVYGHHDGAWVDETSELRPVSKRSRQRVAAEEAWTDLATKNDIPFSIFRLSGIYGPGRNWFINIEKGTSRRLVKPDQVFNRIHREDIGQAVVLAMRKNIGEVFNVTDDDPAPPQDVVTYAHELMGKTPPPEVDFETADISPMARSFYGENKRVSNQKSKDVLGLEYHWPNYKFSLEKLWREGSWKA